VNRATAVEDVERGEDRFVNQGRKIGPGDRANGREVTKKTAL
jgi:hypothetical protein